MEGKERVIYSSLIFEFDKRDLGAIAGGALDFIFSMFGPRRRQSAGAGAL